MGEKEEFEVATEISKSIVASCGTQQEAGKLLKLIARIVELLALFDGLGYGFVCLVESFRFSLYKSL